MKVKNTFKKLVSLSICAAYKNKRRLIFIMKDENDDILLLLKKPEFKQWVLQPTDESNYYWQNWLEQNPDKKASALKARELILRLRFYEGKLTDLETERMFKNIISKNEPTSPPVISTFRFKPLKYAAILMLVVVAGITFWKLRGIKPQTEKTAQEIVYINKSNPKGQKSIIRLRDGTEVHLNSNSTLKYTSDFGIGNRKVELNGEAYFSVAKDQKKPFTVISGNILTTALGTEFNINCRTGNNPRIILTEGKIKVEDRSKYTTPLILLPNQSIDYDIDTGFSAITDIDNLDEILWIHGVLKFEHTPLIKVIDELENWYGVKIQVVGNPQGLHYSGEFKGEYLSNILESMSFSLGLEYVQENEFVELKLKK
ncbi:FecR domain-containing protein [Fulvivirgaceae bacterium BMA12]|uniref:FecR domain-containing protein n=1 Tax=Agaribacillus aureus TaxID=3051825 RepID=A0ABT8L3H4_9BACT|nr:FecR domain-containing protein [Fulvivirgaceae bacterium BMA12]